MARIRTIKPEFCTSEQVVECSPIARLLFIQMWCFCDDAGIHPDKPMRIKMQCFPGDPFTIDQMRGWLDELHAAGLIVRYEADGQRWIKVTGWDKHQKIDRPTCRYPAPPEGAKFDDPSTSPRRGAAEHSPPEGNGREGIGKGKETNTCSPSASVRVTSEDFDSFWSVCPRKVGKGKATEAYRRAVKQIGIGGQSVLRSAMQRAAAAYTAAGTPTDKIPHPATWLSQGRWEDEDPPVRGDGNGRHEQKTDLLCAREML
jgi:hypothetical protein